MNKQSVRHIPQLGGASRVYMDDTPNNGRRKRPPDSNFPLHKLIRRGETNQPTSVIFR
ncbi:MAG: hypothetical protein ACXWPS_12535 [Ktedonobacteraceae bacterium]